MKQPVCRRVDRMTLRGKGVKLANGIIGSRPFQATRLSMRRHHPGTVNDTAIAELEKSLTTRLQEVECMSLHTQRMHPLLMLARRSSFSKNKSARPFSAKDTSDRKAQRLSAELTDRADRVLRSRPCRSPRPTEPLTCGT